MLRTTGSVGSGARLWLGGPGRRREPETRKAALCRRSRSRLGAVAGAARGAPAAPAGAVGDCDRRRECASAERSDARCGPARHLDPPAARAAAARSSQTSAPRAAERWLERSARCRRPSDSEREIVDAGLRHPCRPRFASLFGPGSLAEAPLAATLPDGRVIAGTVDRLLVEEDRILVIDFKTGRVPASDADDPKAPSRADGGLCRCAAGHLPGREVRAALLYTAGPKLFELAA